jgi:hypothetical protein
VAAVSADGPDLSHAADAHMRRTRFRHKCQGMSLLMPLSHSKKLNSLLPQAGREAQRSDKEQSSTRRGIASAKYAFV